MASDLKDFQFYCQDAREHPFDPQLGRLDGANRLLIYVTGQELPQRDTPLDYGHCDKEPAPVFISNPSNPQGPQIKGEFSVDDAPTKWSSEDPYRCHRKLERNTKDSLHLKTYFPLVDGFYNDRLIISITEGRNEEEVILTLFGDSSKRQKIYFAIAVLTDWASYERFLGLMDTRNFVFPMSDIEEQVKEIICLE